MTDESITPAPGPSRPVEDPEARKKFWSGFCLAMLVGVLGMGMLGLPVLVIFFLSLKDRHQPATRGLLIGLAVMFGVGILLLGACGVILIGLSGINQSGGHEARNIASLVVTLVALILAFGVLPPWIKRLLR